jgi:hypothetical protein
LVLTGSIVAAVVAGTPAMTVQVCMKRHSFTDQPFADAPRVAVHLVRGNGY